MAADDETLVRAARRRDAPGRDAFATLVARHEAALCRATRRVCADDALAADAAQDAILAALIGLDGLRDPAAFGAWLTGIGLNAARRLAGRASRDAGPAALDVLASGLPGPAEQAERAAAARRVHAAISALPPGQRDAVALFYLADLTQAEVAEQLGTAEGAVRQRLHNARTALRTMLDDLRQEPPTVPDTTTVPMRIAAVRASGVDAASSSHLVVLAATGDDRRRLPIWIGEPEAHALAAAVQDVALPRPGTHALTAALLAAAGRSVTGVRVDRLDGGIFYAEVVLDDGASVDARPSDALTLAARLGVPIGVAAAVLDAATEPLPAGPDGAEALAAVVRSRYAEDPAR